MKIKTASDIKYMHEYHNPESYFFTRSSMRFFGDTMSNYYVPISKGEAAIVDIITPTGGVIPCYELQRRAPVKHGLCKSAYFAVDGLKRVLSTGE